MPACEKKEVMSVRSAMLVIVAAVGVSMASDAPVRAGDVLAPDIITHDIMGIKPWGTINGVSGYTISTTACNIGTANAFWFGDTEQHPVIAQNLYRLVTIGGVKRIEQLGIGWLKHSYVAATGDLCATCSNVGGGFLGIGCSDTYSTTENGIQIRIGPRSEVNAFTGQFNYPYTIGWNQSGDALYKRIPAPNASISPGTTIVAEAMYVAADDSAAGNQMNNATYRRFVAGSLGSMGYTFTPLQVAQRNPAIYAWQVYDSGVQLSTVNAPNDGRIVVGSRATDLGDGTWAYEYAIENVNSHRSVRLFSVPVGSASLPSVSFRDVSYHSGEPYDGTDWTITQGSNVQWATQTYAENVNANAIRWLTTYNFSFIANQAPVASTATIGLFRPGQAGEPDTLSVSIVAPSVPVTPPPPCQGDANHDGMVNNADLSVLLGQFNQSVTPGSGADFNGDGLVNNADLSVLLGRFNQPCPVG